MLNFSLDLSRSRLNLIFSKIHCGNRPKLIDIGAGNAQLGIALQQTHRFAEYDAVEPDRDVREQYGNWVNAHYSDILKITVSDYDVAIMNQVLEHVPDPVVFLSSVCKLVKPNGYIYIDVPNQDYLFKPNVDPHLLFWNSKSLSTLLDKVGLTLIFCDTAGMPHYQARVFFNQQTFLRQLRNPWAIADKANSILDKLGLPQLFNTFQQFQSDCYGGNPQWLRCVAKKDEASFQ